MYRIGVLQSAQMEAENWTVFTTELVRRGYVPESNLIFVRRYASATGDLDKAARELVDLKVDVIYAYPGSPSALAAKRATSTIPIVFHSSADPVGFGLVRSLARPGLNATGNYWPLDDVTAKSLQLLSEAAGKLTRVAFLHTSESRSFPTYPSTVANAASAGRALRLGIQHTDIGSDLAQTLRALVSQGVDGVVVAAGGPGTDDALWNRLASALISARLPSVGSTDLGFLVYYTPSSSALDRTAARYVDEILRGAKPANIPVEQVSTFDLEINLKTAKALGISIPQGLLVQATSVIR